MPWSVELTGASYTTGEQNKDMTKSRQARGIKDTRTLLLAFSRKKFFDNSYRSDKHGSTSVSG